MMTCYQYRHEDSLEFCHCGRHLVSMNRLDSRAVHTDVLLLPRRPAPHLVAIVDKMVGLLEAKAQGAATFGACHMRMERDMCYSQLA